MADFTLGILGSGQLGRMTIQAAADYGISCHVFAPDANNSPAGEICNKLTEAEYSDQIALNNFYTVVDAVTCEFENVPTDALTASPSDILKSPGVKALATAQNRLMEKETAKLLGIPTVPYWKIGSASDLSNALNALNGSAILKTAKLGYDGKGQIRTKSGDNPEQQWQNINTDLAILETFVNFKKEISFLIARNTKGQTKIFPPTLNYHENGILVHSSAPAILPQSAIDTGCRYVETMANHLGVVGLLAMELFLTEENTLIFNEIAPRPHNSFHWTIEGCKTSQFHQLVRSVSGLPFGEVTTSKKWYMKNILGQSASELQSGYSNAESYVHDYGKADPKIDRKMGHITWCE